MDYRDAGVDISAADAAKARIKALAKGTFNPQVLSEIGSFGGMFRPELGQYREPVLVASTDGVGTKIKVAIAAGVHDTVGYDLVAHCVDDILVQGAVPLFFLDYIALGRMDPARVEQIVAGFARACAEFQCPLIGGETAEMPGTYAADDYDLAGFIVGVVEREKALPRGVREGDVLVGLPSAGLHTNGYSLARKVLFDTLGHGVQTELPELGTSIGAALLAPHRSYLAALEPLLARDKVRALAHITGGGFTDNIPRVLPDGLGVRINLSELPVLPVFKWLAAQGGIAERDMLRTFNCGVGMVLAFAPDQAESVARDLAAAGETVHNIGRIVPGERGCTVIGSAEAWSARDGWRATHNA